MNSTLVIDFTKKKCDCYESEVSLLSGWDVVSQPSQYIGSCG